MEGLGGWGVDVEFSTKPDQFLIAKNFALFLYL